MNNQEKYIKYQHVFFCKSGQNIKKIFPVQRSWLFPYQVAMINYLKYYLVTFKQNGECGLNGII